MLAHNQQIWGFRSDTSYDGGRGFGVLACADGRVGFGKARFSPGGIEAATELNPGLTPVGDSFSCFYTEADLTFGVMWRKSYRRARASIGLGYEFAFLFADNFGGEASSPGELGLEGSIYLYRHGPIVRIYALW